MLDLLGDDRQDHVIGDGIRILDNSHETVVCLNCTPLSLDILLKNLTDKGRFTSTAVRQVTIPSVQEPSSTQLDDTKSDHVSMLFFCCMLNQFSNDSIPWSALYHLDPTTGNMPAIHHWRLVQKGYTCQRPY